MNQYRKLIVAVVGSVVALIAAQYPDLIPVPESLTQAIILALTSFGVFAAPNEPMPDK